MINENSFVPVDKQSLLVRNNWEKVYDSFTTRPVSEIYPDGKIGGQTWKLYLDHGNNYELHISYEPDGRHQCTLYLGSSDASGIPFRLRSLRSMLAKYSLLPEDFPNG